MNRYLTEITEKHIDTIGQVVHDTLPEYKYDKWLQIRLYNISVKLKDNPSMYQFHAEELDLLCMCLNDSLYVLDDCMRDMDIEEDLRECREYKESVEDILRILQDN
jgi:hypothetical protein